jgi:hypothetical protein
MSQQDTRLQEENKPVTTYWLEHYIGPDGLCKLCSNSGKIYAQTVSPYTARLETVVEYCICPNGQDRREQDESRHALEAH